MNWRFLLGLISFSVLITGSYKGVRQIYDSFERKTISAQICRASEARLQVGATREVVDVARSALNAAGYSSAEIELKSSGVVFAQSKLDKKSAEVETCTPEGITGVELAILYPKASLVTPDVFLAFLFSIICLWILKIVIVLFIKGLQTDFSNEINKMLSAAIGLESEKIEKTPSWMKWLHELNPAALKDFRNRISSMEYKIERQAQDLKNQAIEKAVKESQLVEARKFKDLVHQIRHDLRQTVGVVRSGFFSSPDNNKQEVLRGAISSLESMIEDLRERENKHQPDQRAQMDLIEVIIAEAVNEQRVSIGRHIQIDYQMSHVFLHMVKAPREEIKRIIVNLIVNASEAILDFGSIELETSSSTKNQITIRVIDSGIGFSPEAVRNLFKKGFSTKKSGSGRGLSFAQSKVREWGGNIFVESDPGRTVVEITLPAIQTESWVHPAILRKTKDMVVIDDHPIRPINHLAPDANIVHYNCLADFEAAYLKGLVSTDAMIVFDLHLDEGRQAIDALGILKQGQDYILMTSDHLNPRLVKVAAKRQFLTIPKELISFELMSERDPATGPKRGNKQYTRPESSAQI